MFVFHSTDGMLILLIYVDDIILIGDSMTLLNQFVARLGSEFSITDLGDLLYFLGVEAKRTNAGLVLSQSKYTLDLLYKTGMQSCKPSKTPVMLGSKLSLHSKSSLSDPHEYRSVVGALQYLTITRPDLS